MEFDESEAIKYMRRHVGEDLSTKYDDDELLNLIDIVYDYYESNGLLELDLSDDDDELDVEDLMEYISRMLRKDKRAQLSVEDARPLLEAYLEYEESLDE